MTQDEIELTILRRYVDQHRAAQLRNPGSKCEQELDMREVLADITGYSGNELTYQAELWLTRLAPQTRPSRRPLRRCSDSNRNDRDHRWHARAYVDSGSGNAPAWDRIRHLEARLPDIGEQKPNWWKRCSKWLFSNILEKALIGVLVAILVPAARSCIDSHAKPTPINRQTASIEFENTEPFVAREDFADDRTRKHWYVYLFKVRIGNPSDRSTIHITHWKLIDLRRLDSGVFRLWEDAEPVFLNWNAPKELPPQDHVLIPFARIYPAELQSKLEEDLLFSGDVDIPQLRFIVDGWPRKMRSDVPPGTHRFKLAVFFENAPPSEAEFELDWPGKQRDSIESMVQEIKITKLK